MTQVLGGTKMDYLHVEIESVFDSIKERLGGIEVYANSFDNDILASINGAFATLHQLGIDDREGKPIVVTNTDQKWSDFLDMTRYRWLKDYVYFKVRLVFDPPANSSVLSSMQSQLDEMTWRIEVERDMEINGYV